MSSFIALQPQLVLCFLAWIFRHLFPSETLLRPATDSIHTESSLQKEFGVRIPGLTKSKRCRKPHTIISACSRTILSKTIAQPGETTVSNRYGQTEELRGREAD